MARDPDHGLGEGSEADVIVDVVDAFLCIDAVAIKQVWDVDKIEINAVASGAQDGSCELIGADTGRHVVPSFDSVLGGSSAKVGDNYGNSVAFANEGLGKGTKDVGKSTSFDKWGCF